jgi:Amt family ammonium transporter
VVAFVAAYAIMWIIEAVTDLRLAPEKELAGLDLEEHGTSAYPEYVLSGNDGTPKTLEDAKVMVRSSAPAAGD